MKMRRYKLFLMFCMAGLCLISFLHFFKTLSYVTFPRELASLSPNLVSSFFWNNAPVTPQASPEPGDPDLLRTPLYSHSPLLQPLPPSKAAEELHRVDFLGDVVDAFVVCESNFTAYGEPRPLKFREMLTNGTFEYIRHKVLYVFLDHFPPGGRQDGWIADDYLRTFLTQDGVSRLRNLRPDDVFIIDDADEIPARDGVLFLKLYDGWTEPFAFHMRKSLYGFFWKQPGTLEVVSGCTVDMLQAVYGLDGIRLRRRQYYTMPNFRQYENRTGHILVQWSLGSPLHFAGWHCSWCFTPEGIYFKLVSAQNGDFPRWGDYEDKRDLNYIRGLIRTGGWFDGTQQEYPPADPSEHMYAPKYLLKNYDQFRYLLDNPYQEPRSTAAGGRRHRGPEGRLPARGKLDEAEG
uniref:Beta-1,4-mannosyl-glycoprotein 4-beta-N-acetylglucosaminyltransferase n=1 Tax=Colobus angolensis palliatus TaxID=336983 RepID=A0A2K5HR89_COLAP